MLRSTSLHRMRPLPVAILKATLEAMSPAFPSLAQLALEPRLEKVAQQLAGIDGRRIRKTISEAMIGRHETVVDPGLMTVEDLLSAAARVKQYTRPAQKRQGD